MTSKLANPSAEELKQSTILQEMIREEMLANGGTISFESYMYRCLYTPGLGYYTGQREIFSQQGDFITSSEHGNHYACAFASHIHALKLFTEQITIIEIGAGNGVFANDLITALLASSEVSIQYYIVEISQPLITRQRDRLKAYLDRDDIKIEWLASVDFSVDCGIIIANEVIDALPVHLISVHDKKVFERHVSWDEDQGFAYQEMAVSENIETLVQERLPASILSSGAGTYHTEMNTALDDFIRTTAAYINKGVLMFVDYGYPRQEYYLAQRSMGTLICHYQHQAHDNPLIWPGLQDISCNVDFTALAEAGLQSGLEVNCYTTQAQFLLASDYFQALQVKASNSESAMMSSQLKNLLMPDAMGERFQIMVFTKNINLTTAQFTLRDLTYRL